MSKPEDTRELTFGEKAVGLTFNPSQNEDVRAIKVECAALIDYLYALKEDTDNPEVKRMLSIAITETQTAQMWGVKAATWEL